MSLILYLNLGNVHACLHQLLGTRQRVKHSSQALSWVLILISHSWIPLRYVNLYILSLCQINFLMLFGLLLLFGYIFMQCFHLWLYLMFRVHDYYSIVFWLMLYYSLLMKCSNPLIDLILQTFFYLFVRFGNLIRIIRDGFQLRN